MSLHRVSSLESWDNLINNERRNSHQRITFNPIADLISPTNDKTGLITPKEVSKGRRIGMLTLPINVEPILISLKHKLSPPVYTVFSLLVLFLDMLPSSKSWSQRVYIEICVLSQISRLLDRHVINRI